MFIASTTGEGTVPDNMRSFWRFLLRKDLPAGSLGAMQHACFGLGDSSYPKFNYAAKRLHRRLLQLGSTALVDLGLADDQDDLGIDQALGPWLDGFRARLMALRPMADGLAAIPRSQSLPLRYRLLEEEEEEEEGDGAATVAGPPPEAGGPPSAAAPFEARVLANESLCGAARGSRDVRHLELDIAGSGIAYTPGDALAVQPRNPPAETRALLAGLGLEPEQRIVLAPAAPRAAPPLPPGEWSVFRLFSERLDLFGVPRRAFFERLARHVGRAAAPTHTSGVAPASATDACVRLCRRRPPRRTRPRRPALALEPGTRAASRLACTAHTLPSCGYSGSPSSARRSSPTTCATTAPSRGARTPRCGKRPRAAAPRPCRPSLVRWWHSFTRCCSSSRRRGRRCQPISWSNVPSTLFEERAPSALLSGPRPLLLTPKRSLSILETCRGFRSPLRAAPKSRVSHLSPAGLPRPHPAAAAALLLHLLVAHPPPQRRPPHRRGRALPDKDRQASLRVRDPSRPSALAPPPPAAPRPRPTATANANANANANATARLGAVTPPRCCVAASAPLTSPRSPPAAAPRRTAPPPRAHACGCGCGPRSSSWLKTLPALPDDPAPSASLDHLSAQAAPTHPRAPTEHIGSSPWPQGRASGRPNVEDFPLPTTRSCACLGVTPPPF